MSALGDFIVDGLNSIGTNIGDACNNVARTIFRTGIKLFNSFCGNAYNLFTMSPEDFGGSNTWDIIESVNIVFISIATSLVMVFWLIGFVQQTVDAKEELRIEQMIKMYLKISFAEFFVIHAFDIVNGLFNGAIEIASFIFQSSSSLSIDYSSTFYPYLVKFNSSAGCTGVTSMGYNICLIVVGALFTFVTIFSSAGILLQAVKRFMKILVLIPYGTLASSTLAGGHTINRTAEGFYRYAIASAMEVITMLLAIAIGVKLLTMDATFGITPASNLNGSYGDMFVDTVYAIVVKGFLITCISTGVKQSESLTQRIIGG